MRNHRLDLDHVASLTHDPHVRPDGAMAARIDPSAITARVLRGMPKRNGLGIELLADPTRRSLIAAIAVRPRRPSVLAEEIGLSRPATTRQLRLLEQAGLIRASRAMTDRRGVVYTMDARSHGRITAWLAGIDIGRRLATGPTVPEPDD